MPNDEAGWRGLGAVLLKAAHFYRTQLNASPRALDYLASRGVTAASASHFEIGYAPQGWRPLETVFTNYEAEVLAEAGLVIDGDRRRYDRFRDRIMFPIEDSRGNLIAFAGRMIDEGLPTYFYTPETSFLSKARELYNLPRARRAIEESRTVVVVESCMDVVRLRDHGIENAVMALGTSLSPEHIKKLFRIAERVVLSAKGDARGNDAAARAAESLAAVQSDDKDFRVLFLPQGEGLADYLAKRGKAAFEHALASAPPLRDV